MKRRTAHWAVLVLFSVLFLTSPLGATARAQGTGATESDPTLHRGWLSRIESWRGIPQDLAFGFGRSALRAGLTKSQAARMLNDDRFALAVGSPDQGYGLLEALIADPGQIRKAHELLADGRYTASGADSLQTALMDVFPELRNAYLQDLGLVAVKGQAGILILVDIESGRQYFDDETLGGQVTAPGGGPLPTPSVSPEEAGAQMSDDSGIDPNDPVLPEIAAAGPTGPGFNFRTDEPSHGLLTPAVYLVAGAFLVAWMGYAAVVIARHFRQS